MATKVIMPQLGESVVEGTVTKWLKAKGDTVQEMEALLEVNTDKVDTEIPSPASGVLLEILVPEGTTVQAGTVIAWIGEPGEPLPSPVAAAGASAEPVPEAIEKAPFPSSASPERELGFISPVVARMAKEYQIDLSQVKGSGQGGRITKKDLLAYLEERQEKEAALAEAQPIWETPADGDLFRPTELVFGKPAPATPTPTAALTETL
ncbi:MAG: E3 binding domain-containing protein, partial [Desulfitobacteriaceae bacterium]|nr:E3 binding domain-containing protein [Desulfitobacteriaceae bacterium]